MKASARVNAELVHEYAARVVVGLESLGLTAGAVESEHQLTAKALAERVLFDKRFELADELGALNTAAKPR